jgi:hypothetical protein
MEDVMSEDRVRDEIAFIRTAIGEGRNYVMGRSWDFVIWGVATIIMYLGIYARVLGWWDVDITVIWLVCMNLPWLYTLRGITRSSRAAAPPMARAMGALWLGCAITLGVLATAFTYTGDMRGWFAAIAAGVMAIGFFGSALLCNLPWMRWVAVGWWLGALATAAIHRRPEVLPVAAALTFLLLVLPGIVLLRSRPTLATA